MRRCLTYLAFLTCLLASTPLFAQVGSNPATHQNVRIGGGPTDTELPFPGGTDLDDSGNVISSGEHAVGASTTTKAMFLLTPGVAPTSPGDGNLWIVNAQGLFVQVMSVTIGPLIGVAAFDTEPKLEVILTDTANVFTDNDATYDSTQATVVLLDTATTNLSIGGAATTMTIGAPTGTTTIDNDLSVSDELTVVGTGASTIAGALGVNGAAITSDDGTFALLDTTPTTVDAFGNATTVSIGAATGTTTVENNLTVAGTIVSLTNAAAVAIQTTLSRFEINSVDPTGTANLDLNARPTTSGQDGAIRLGRTGTVTGGGASTTQWFIGDGTGTQTAQLDMLLGALQLDDDIDVDGGDFNTVAATFSILDLTPTTINFGGAATTITIGAATGTTTIDNDLSVSDELTVVGTGASSIAGALGINGAALTSDDATFALLDVTPTTVNAFGAATTVSIGAATGTTTIDNDLSVSDELTVVGTGASTIAGALGINGASLTSDDATFALLDVTPTTVNAFGAATTVSIGAATGTTTIDNDLTVSDELLVSGAGKSFITGPLDITGLFVEVVAKVGTYTATTVDHVILGDATTGSFEIDLPAVSGNSGLMFHIKKTDASGNTVTIDGSGAETIDGAATVVISTQFESFMIVCDGTEWHII